MQQAIVVSHWFSVWAVSVETQRTQTPDAQNPSLIHSSSGTCHVCSNKARLVGRARVTHISANQSDTQIHTQAESALHAVSDE